MFNLHKKSTWDGMSRTKIANTSNSMLVPIHYAGLNPYKAVEMYQKYRPVVPEDFHSDDLYAEPSVKVWSNVKTQKIDRSKFWKKQKRRSMQMTRTEAPDLDLRFCGLDAISPLRGQQHFSRLKKHDLSANTLRTDDIDTVKMLMDNGYFPSPNCGY